MTFRRSAQPLGLECFLELFLGEVVLKSEVLDGAVDVLVGHANAVLSRDLTNQLFVDQERQELFVEPLQPSHPLGLRPRFRYLGEKRHRTRPKVAEEDRVIVHRGHDALDHVRMRAVGGHQEDERCGKDSAHGPFGSSGVSILTSSSAS